MHPIGVEKNNGPIQGTKLVTPSEEELVRVPGLYVTMRLAVAVLQSNHVPQRGGMLWVLLNEPVAVEVLLQ